MRVLRSALLYYAAKKSEDAMNNLKKALQQDETHVLALLTQVTDGEIGTFEELGFSENVKLVPPAYTHYASASHQKIRS